MIIGIAGSSGVGKSIISSLLKKFMSKNFPLLLCGDNYHKWERKDPNWQKYTHLNPDANYLDRAVSDLTILKNGGSILVREYNHDTGKFDEEKSISSSDTIIFEGLHSLLDCFYSITDIKIFVDTDEKLKTNWKIKRDTQRRGYTVQQVLDAIKQREPDEKKYILPQKHNADIVVKFSLNDSGDVIFSYYCVDSKHEEFMRQFNIFYNNIQNFITMCKEVSYDYSLVQCKGGNISCKLNNQEMLITCSGNSLNDVNVDVNYTIFNYYQFNDIFLRCNNYFAAVKECSYNSVASMESGLHALFKEKFVIHVHPIHLNTILCAENCDGIIQEMYSDLDYTLIPYVTPGEKLMEYLRDNMVKSNVIFMKNHGLIVTGKDFKAVISTVRDINSRSREWIVQRSMSYLPYYKTKNIINTPPLFPDAVIIPKMQEINETIHKNIVDCDLIPSYLTDSQVGELKNMEFEKYRGKL